MRRSVNIIDFIALISFYADAIIWILGRRQTSGGGTFVEEENIIQFIDVIRTFRYLIVTYVFYISSSYCRIAQIYKLTRHFPELQILVQTLRASAQVITIQTI